MHPDTSDPLRSCSSGGPGGFADGIPSGLFLSLTTMSTMTRRLTLLLAAGACGLSTLLPPAASAQVYNQGYRDYRGYPAVPTRNWPPAPYQDYNSQAPNGTTPFGQPPVPRTWEEAQALQQRCSIGRLVGGVLGGGLGYAASRGDGRTWVVPLGALLGSQVGCNTGQGRGPLPW
jgi:hypothetical protein